MGFNQSTINGEEADHSVYCTTEFDLRDFGGMCRQGRDEKYGGGTGGTSIYVTFRFT